MEKKMKEKIILIMSILLITLTTYCSSPESVKVAVDPMEALNAQLKPARVIGYDIGNPAPSKAKLAQWDKEFLPVIKSVYDKMPEGYKLQIRGNTDTEGSNAENLEVGEKRAKFVYDYLLKKGLKANKMVVVSKGEESPMEGIDPTDDTNRRVNFRVIKD